MPAPLLKRDPAPAEENWEIKKREIEEEKVYGWAHGKYLYKIEAQHILEIWHILLDHFQGSPFKTSLQASKLR